MTQRSRTSQPQVVQQQRRGQQMRGADVWEIPDSPYLPTLPFTFGQGSTSQIFTSVDRMSQDSTPAAIALMDFLVHFQGPHEGLCWAKLTTLLDRTVPSSMASQVCRKAIDRHGIASDQEALLTLQFRRNELDYHRFVFGQGVSLRTLTEQLPLIVSGLSQLDTPAPKREAAGRIILAAAYVRRGNIRSAIPQATRCLELLAEEYPDETLAQVAKSARPAEEYTTPMRSDQQPTGSHAFSEPSTRRSGN